MPAHAPRSGGRVRGRRSRASIPQGERSRASAWRPRTSRALTTTARAPRTGGESRHHMAPPTILRRCPSRRTVRLIRARRFPSSRSECSRAGVSATCSPSRCAGAPTPLLGASTKARRPPTAPPGTHHVLSRVFKDIFPRYRTMRGHYVERKGGWDCHGLPVELAVEAELGIAVQGGHRALRDRGVQRPLPREGPQPRRGLEPADRADRLLDRPRRRLPHARPRLHRVGVVGAQQIHDHGLLYEKLKVVPYCPRCGTALSSHELGQPDVYRDVDRPVGLRPLAGDRAQAAPRTRATS